MSEIHTMPGHLIRRLHQISVSVFAERMRSAGFDLTAPQFGTLAVLADWPGIDQATLAGLIALDRPTTGGVVERLEAKGLLSRRTSDTDRRAKVLALTEAGADLLAKTRPVVRAMQADLLPGLTDEEREDFMRLATKIADAGNDLSRAPMIAPKVTA